MTEIKEAALGICLLAVAVGLFRMLIPDGKYKTQITFLTACIFSVCVLSTMTKLVPVIDTEIAVSTVPAVDFSDKLSEQARITAARGVREKLKELLANNGYSCSKIYITANIDGAFCISITEVELLFPKDTPDEYMERAAALVESRTGDITVRYAKER